VRRWAVPLACFAFALLSVPLALVARGSRGVAYLMTVGVFIAFYALSRVSMAFAASGMNPWVAGFIPDLCIFALLASQTRQLLRNGIGKPG
jgi:lipopolysaccharide export LptBFGC system permease protein LptF